MTYWGKEGIFTDQKKATVMKQWLFCVLPVWQQGGLI